MVMCEMDGNEHAQLWVFCENFAKKNNIQESNERMA